MLPPRVDKPAWTSAARAVLAPCDSAAAWAAASPAAAAYAGDDPTRTLRNLTLSLAPGALCVVTGATGSGKSELLSALIGEADVLAGDVAVGGALAYAPQTAWAEAGTLRDNVVFAGAGAPCDAGRFADAVAAACLEPDLARLPLGADTELGARGGTLSGGQRHRLALARAHYARADAVALDDPLAALDANVARRVVERGLLGGALARATRVVVSSRTVLADDLLSSRGGRG